VAQEFKLPDVGEGIDSGTVVAVLVAEGDRIEVDQPVIELETDKAVVEVPSTVSGIVTKVHVSANSEARVGQVVLTVDEADAAAAEATEAPAAPRAEAPRAEAPRAEAPRAEAPREEIADVDEEVGEPDVEAAYDPRFDAAAADTQRGGATATATPGATPRREPAAPGSAPVPGSKNGRDGQEGRSGALIPAAPSVRRLARERGVDLSALQG
jgi:pyruvate dehydrogenase E2 component (dihydrolipoamide acetyltransferase)